MKNVCLVEHTCKKKKKNLVVSSGNFAKRTDVSEPVGPESVRSRAVRR